MKVTLSTILFASSALAAAVPFNIPYPSIGLVRRAPANIPGKAEVEKMLEGLKVAPKANGDTYDRDLFKHWSNVNGTCNTREVVLARDGTNVEQDAACKAVKGTWKSPYDDGTWNSATDIQIDHMVALHEAWQSGASEWSNAEREKFANDLDSPQLWAVTGTVNNDKGSDDPSMWKPPLESFHCTYASAYVAVKATWKLTVTEAEKKACAEMIGKCK